MRAELTKKQYKFYNLVYDFIRRNQYSPTARDLSSMCDVSIGTIEHYLDVLEEKGYIKRKMGKARTLRLVDDIIGVPTVKMADVGKALIELKNEGEDITLEFLIKILKKMNIKMV